MREWPELQPMPPGAPAVGAVHGLCPVCDCGGYERPCWCCGYSGRGFTTSAAIVIQRQPVPARELVPSWRDRAEVRAKRRRLGLYVE